MQNLHHTEVISIEYKDEDGTFKNSNSVKQIILINLDRYIIIESKTHIFPIQKFRWISRHGI